MSVNYLGSGRFRMRPASAVLCSAWLALLMMGPVAAAETPGDAVETLKKARACTVEPDRAKRLACYDLELGPATAPRAAAAAAPPAAAVAAPPTVAAAAPPAAAASPAAEFGMTPELARRAQARTGVKAPSAPAQVTGKVAAVLLDPHGKVVVTLDDGQVWQQKDYNLRFPVQVGDEVHFKTGALGALWMLDAHDQLQTRVTRLK